MGICFLKNKKGQISIEFILIMLIALIYIHSVIQPTINIASQSTEDVTRLGEVKLAAQKLAGAINELEANHGDGRKTIMLFVPKNSSVGCFSDGIEFNAIMSNLAKPVGCKEVEGKVECRGTIGIIPRASPNCNFDGETEIGSDNSNIFRKVVIAKDSSGINVRYAS